MTDQPPRPGNDQSGSLTDEERRLNALLGPFLEAEQAGRPVDRIALLESHPALAAALSAFFADYDRLRALAGPLRAAVAGPGDALRAGRPARPSPETDLEVTHPPTPDPEVTSALEPTETVVGDPGDLDLADSSTASVVRYFGDYAILGRLGRGGMGVVYKARQVSLNRFVALKMLRAGALASEDNLRRFQTEAEAVAALDHPNIVPVYEVGEHLGRRYFSMKFIPGQSLATRLDEYAGRFDAAAELVVAISAAVHHAHRAGHPPSRPEAGQHPAR